VIGNAFSVDSTGKKIVLNASADVEFVSASDQTALGLVEQVVVLLRQGGAGLDARHRQVAALADGGRGGRTTT
jgi:hypothetical protein